MNTPDLKKSDRERIITIIRGRCKTYALGGIRMPVVTSTFCRIFCIMVSEELQK